jgi:exportin-2 (importin alpha re-exporter)
MLELHKQEVPATYRELLPFLLTPAVWNQKGSVPGLVKLLKAFLERDAKQIVANNQHLPILAVVQQRLIRSKINDTWGFELLQSVFQHLPV